ncbi:MAG: ABC transporter ATP-binding protein [Lachnospiraceae bacterium]
MQEKTIEIKGLNKSFKGIPVLQNVSMECRAGEIVGIVGRNGAGKTVLFKILCGLLTPDSGEIIIKGKVKKNLTETFSKAGIIIEEPAFLRNYSGIKNLEYLYLINNKNNIAYLEHIMEKVGLDGKSKKYVGKYSMGMRQRLAIAQAIMEDPEFLILDEPFNGLDNRGVEEMRDLFLELKKEGKTILVASHNTEDIKILCDCVYNMEAGVLRPVEAPSSD